MIIVELTRANGFQFLKHSPTRQWHVFVLSQCVCLVEVIVSGLRVWRATPQHERSCAFSFFKAYKWLRVTCGAAAFVCFVLGNSVFQLLLEPCQQYLFLRIMRCSLIARSVQTDAVARRYDKMGTAEFVASVTCMSARTAI